MVVGGFLRVVGGEEGDTLSLAELECFSLPGLEGTIGLGGLAGLAGRTTGDKDTQLTNIQP